jgi:hypothetical protein
LIFFRKHIVPGFFLLLVLFYSAPVKSLHSCNNLSHHADELAYETAHQDCPICDLQFCPLLPDPQPAAALIYPYSKPLTAAYQSAYTSSLCNASLNKGPPAAPAYTA